MWIAMTVSESSQEKIALVGLSVRMPGIKTPDEFWRAISTGDELVKEYSVSELQKAGISSSALTEKHYIHSKASIEDATAFAADFFKMNPHQAKVLDPQCRLALECVWECFENAGHNIETTPDRVGVYASSSTQDNYLSTCLVHDRVFSSNASKHELLINNATDFLATRIAYQFNFKGPSLNIQTACSSALVSIKYACDALRQGEIDSAVVASMSITFPLVSGYFYKEGMIFSQDGHCRPFANNATGIVPGNGGGALLLKRLCDAKADGDEIYAIISGAAVNNGGHDKISYAAPNVAAQIEVMESALAQSSLTQSDINFIEAHGTGTVLGDLIELEALNHVYNGFDQKRYIGSVKGNLGHLDVAAGFAGFVKTALSLYHRTLPPSINVECPHDALSNSECLGFCDAEVNFSGEKLAAGVSAFGVGGTNAHLILEHYKKPERKPLKAVTDYVLLLSARNEQELAKTKDRLVTALHQMDRGIQDVATTLQEGRKQFPYREIVLANSLTSAVDALYVPDSNRCISRMDTSYAGEWVYVIPDDMETAHSLLTHFYRSNRLFATSVDNLVSLIREAGLNYSVCQGSYVDIIVSQLALLGLFKQCKLRVSQATGVGVAAFVAELFLEKRSYKEAVEQLVHIDMNEASFLVVMLPSKNLGDILSPTEYSLIATVTQKSCIIQFLSDSVFDKFKQHEVIYVEHTNVMLNRIPFVKSNTALLADDIVQLTTAYRQQDICGFFSVGCSAQYLKWIQQASHADDLSFSFVHCLASDVCLSVVSALSQLWVQGVEFDWSLWREAQIEAGKCHRLALPTYPFSRDRYEVAYQNRGDEVMIRESKPAELSSCFYHETWSRLDLQLLDNQLSQTLLIASDFSIWSLAQTKHASLQTLTLFPEQDVCIGSYKDLRHIFIDVSDLNGQCIYGVLISLVKQIAEQGSKLLHLTVLGELSDPEQAMALGPVAAYNKEFPACCGKFIDISRATSTELLWLLERDTASIDSHILSLSQKGLSQHALVKTLPSINNALNKQALRKHGVYVFFGGLSGIALSLALSIAKEYQANIVLVGRTQCGEKNDWISSMSSGELSPGEMFAIQHLSQIEEHANQLLYLKANVAKRKEVRHVLDQVSYRFGAINGVFHAATELPSGLMVKQSLAPRVMLNAKVRGAKNIVVEMLTHESPDFICLFSALNTYYQEAGVSDYIAANAFLIRYVESESTPSYLRAIAWDAWCNGGMKLKLQFRTLEINSAYSFSNSRYQFLLDEHVLDDKMLLLGALMIELAVSRKFSISNPMRLGQIVFISPSVISSIEEYILYASYCDTGIIEYYSSSAGKMKSIMRVGTSTQDQINAPETSLDDLLSSFSSVDNVKKSIVDNAKTDRIKVGPHWDCLTWVKYHDNRYLALLTLPSEYEAELTDFVLHPALLDVAYSYHAEFIEDLYLPFYIETFSVYQTLPATFYSFIQITERDLDQGIVRSNTTLFSLSGAVLCSIEGLTLRKGSSEVLEQKKQDETNEITAEEGYRILKQGLLSDLPNVIVSKNSPERSIGTVKAPAQTSEMKISLKSAETLKDKIRILWSEVLEIDEIADEDNFFDLNGDSLSSIQLSYLIKTNLYINTDPNLLLRAPTFVLFYEHVGELVSEDVIANDLPPEALA
jgi:3-oxoacyl-(acyl-carrier-protein) synthase/acyl carrier protein